MYDQLKNYFGNPFDIYPNPSNNSIQVDMHTDAQVESISILNAMGQRVYSNNGLWSKPIEIRHLPAGVYVVQVRLKYIQYKQVLILQ
jgi:hypothetical protein